MTDANAYTQLSEFGTRLVIFIPRKTRISEYAERFAEALL